MSRHRLQFRLRTLFVVVTLAAAACGLAAWLRWQTNAIHQRQDILSEVLEEGGALDPYRFAPKNPRSLPWWRLALGDKAVPVLVVADHVNAEERDRIHAAFPEADIYQWVVTDDDASGPETLSLKLVLPSERP